MTVPSKTMLNGSSRHSRISQQGALEARGGHHDGPLVGGAAAIPDEGIPEDLRAELIPHWRRWTKVFYAVRETLE